MNPLRSTWLVLGLVAVLHPRPADARAWIVDLDGGGDFTSITQACQAAGAGDTVAIQPGEYDEYDGPSSPVLISNKPLSVIGMGNVESVRARISLRFYACEGLLFENITFHDEYTPIYADNCPTTIRACHFLDNGRTNQSPSAAVCVYSSGPALVEDCLFARNRAGAQSSGGALNVTACLTIRRCQFMDNEASDYGGAISSMGSCTVIEDCLFVGNVASDGAAVYVYSYNSAMTDCTFYVNRTTSRGGAAIVTELTGPAGQNVRCIVAGTVNGYGVGGWGGLAPQCFCFWQNEMGSVSEGAFAPASDGNFEADPLFCDAPAGDFHLNAASSCLFPEHGGWPCGQIGAYGAACGATPMLPSTWGRIKARYHQ